MRIALLTTHYGDPFWVQLLVERVRTAFPDITDERLYVIDQDRTDDSAARLRDLLGPVNVLRYPRSDPHFDMTAHDHAHVLNLAVREIDADVTLVFDSDAHPIGTNLHRRLMSLLETSDAVLAATGSEGTASHPCFMAFGPAVDRDTLFFDEGQLERGVDTGRKIYDQIHALGLRGELLRPTPAFDGQWGSFFLDGSLYHHGSASFGSSSDPRFRRQVGTWRREERLIRRNVARGRYRLSPLQRRLLRASRAVRKTRDRVENAVRRRLGISPRRTTAA